VHDGRAPRFPRVNHPAHTPKTGRRRRPGRGLDRRPPALCQGCVEERAPVVAAFVGLKCSSFRVRREQRCGDRMQTVVYAGPRCRSGHSLGTRLRSPRRVSDARSCWSLADFGGRTADAESAAHLAEVHRRTKRRSRGCAVRDSNPEPAD
jgi:hypothetical protein